MRYLFSLLFCLLSVQAAFNPAQVASWRPSLLNGLVAYWPLDEASGTRYCVVCTNHLADFNSVSSADGIISNGITNNGTTTKYLAAQSTLFSFTTNNFSVSAWCYFSNTGTDNDYIGIYNGSANRRSWLLGIVSGKLTAQISTNGTSRITTLQTTLSQGAWHHVVFSVSNAVGLLYTNGTISGTLSLNSALFYNGTEPLTLGRKYDEFTPMVGKLDESAIWNRVLTANEVRLLYNIGRGRRFPFNSGP